MGNDGHIWGGEFFLYNKTNAVRLCHFEYFPFLLGDKMPKEPRISALAATLPLPGAAALLKSKFSDLEWRNYQILAGRTKLHTSSVGRLFDAVASMLGLSDRTSYEGEAAMRLERLGQDYIKSNGPDFSGSYLNEQDIKDTIPITLLLSKVIDDLQNGLGRDFIAAKFHNSLAEVVKVIALRYNLQKIAFSGGVFQNELLVDLIRLRLGQEYELYFHRNLSPNDECVSYGKLIGYLMQQAHQVENKVI
jgi:hydrogenase maturation protein HypF